MTHKPKILLIWLLVFFLVASCSTPEKSIPTPTSSRIESTSATEVNTVSPQNTSEAATPTPVEPKSTATNTSSVTSSSTSVFASANQVTDGKLKITIEGTDVRCYKPGETIPIKVTYQNLTDKRLTIVDFNIVSSVPLIGANALLIPVLTSTADIRVHSPDELMSSDAANASPTVLHELLPKSSFESFVEYHLPIEIISFDNNQRLQSGQYLLKFVYTALSYKGSWDGAISSNQTEICVSE